MGFADRLENFIEKRFNPEKHKFAIKQKAQIKLMEKYGTERAGTWLDAYENEFNLLIENQSPHLIKELETNEPEALQKIESILYH